MIRIGIIGYGYWGPRIARNFYEAKDCEVSIICDANVGRLQRAAVAFPGVATTSTASEVTRSPQVAR